ncbi:MAG: hypothetical protein JKY37_32670 [Nannocystaceae bacterium]|nr:hypothetical protein [Nannocystaceae bacterium]
MTPIIDSGRAPHRHSAAGHGLSWLACGLMLVASPGCNRTKGNAASQLTEAPTVMEATGESKCGVRASTAKPLIVEWPATERAALEARATRGLVAVRYEGCEMEVLTNCTAKGSYTYLGLNQKREAVRIKNADELYAQLPVGAAGLEAKLERSGQLNVDMVIIGRKESDRSQFKKRDLEGRCDGATHVITGLTVGAFSFYTGTSASLGAGVKIGHVGVGAASSAEQEVLKQDGDEDSCALAEQGADEPPPGCGALLRVEVVPIDEPIFGPKTPLATGGTGTGTGPNDAGRTNEDRLASVKSARTWQLIGLSGYVVSLVGLGAAVGGVALRKKAETAIPTTDPGDPRQKQLSNYKVGAGLFIGGVSAAGIGFIVGALGLARAKKAKRGASVSPAFGPRMAGAQVEVRF